MTPGTRAYTLAELQALKAEYLATLDDFHDSEWYTTERDLADSELAGFFKWLNLKEWTP